MQTCVSKNFCSMGRAATSSVRRLGPRTPISARLIVEMYLLIVPFRMPMADYLLDTKIEEVRSIIRRFDNAFVEFFVVATIAIFVI